jgi:hypothetical protein
MQLANQLIWKVVFLVCCRDLAEVCTGTQTNLLVCSVASESVQDDGNRRYMITVDIMKCLKEVRKQ